MFQFYYLQQKKRRRRSRRQGGRGGGGGEGEERGELIQVGNYSLECACKSKVT